MHVLNTFCVSVLLQSILVHCQRSMSMVNSTKSTTGSVVVEALQQNTVCPLVNDYTSNPHLSHQGEG